MVNVYNTTIPDEDDALVQITNHGSSIHHAGFLTDTQLYALSHDENFSVYPLASQHEEPASGECNAPTKFGDLRGLLNCEYIVDIITLSGNGNAIIGAGIHRYISLIFHEALPNSFLTKAPFSDRSSLALIPLHQSGSKWCINPDRAIQLDGAHGPKIVRSICFPNSVSFCSYIHAFLVQLCSNCETCRGHFWSPFPPLTYIPVSDGSPRKGARKMANSNIFTFFN